MNQAHLHLLLNHLPILGVLFGLLTLTAGYVLKNQSIKRMALGLFVFSAAFAVPTYLSGEGAEDLVENLPGAGDQFVETHEETAVIFLWAVGALGLLSILTLLADLRLRKIASGLYIVTLISGLIVMATAQRTSTTGGEIRHTEIRSGAAVDKGSAQNGSTEAKDDD